MLKTIYDRAASLNLGLWLTGGIMVLLGIGSVAGGGEGAGNINSMALFAWLAETPVARSWWLWATVALLALLALNTVPAASNRSGTSTGAPGSWYLQHPR